ncbi:MAG: stage V sporulation protein AE [Defluviitaleaceae bacterium]|nr:stage V sporulation protein AE [Defluviitaleaceae bacterium]
MIFLKAFIIGGLLCVIGQILIDKTKLTPARIMVGFVVAGAILSGIGIYNSFAEFAGSGATVPIVGFGHALVQGVFKEIDQIGFLGIFTGGLRHTAPGIAAAIIFGLIAAIVAKPKLP